MAIGIEVDTSQGSVADYFGHGDGKYQNIVADSLSEVDVIAKEIKVKKLTAHYRYDHRKEDFLQKELSRNANEVGKEIDVPLWFTHRHSDADKILDYMRKDEIAKAAQFSFTGLKTATLSRNARINIVAPDYGIDSDWQIMDITQLKGKYNLKVKRYIPLKYTYEAAAGLPDDEIVPNIENTPADPISGLTVQGSVRLSEQSDRSGVLDISWTTPDEGNYSGAEVFIKENGEGASSYKSYGTYFDGAQIQGLKANQAYDVQVISFGENPVNRGFPIEKTNTSTSSGTTKPNEPSAPSVTRSGRNWTFRGTAPFSSEPIKDVEWEVDPSSGPNYIVSSGQYSISHTEDGTGSESARARFRVRNIYDQWSDWSDYSSSVSTEKWDQGHLNSNSVGNSQLQTDAVETANIKQANITTAKIGLAAVETAKIKDLAVETLKRQDVEHDSDGWTGITATSQKKEFRRRTFNHSLGKVPIAVIRASFNTQGTTNIINSAYVDSITSSSITVVLEVGNLGGQGAVSGIEMGFDLYYW